MVADQIEARGIADARVLQALATVPRHLFLAAGLRERAYDDAAIPIGPQQSISQPYVVALMTELARPRASDRALEIGTGSGYQAAVLAELVESVYTIELDPALHDLAVERFLRMHYRNVVARCSDGAGGWPEAAPFDVILVTAGAPRIEPAWRAQLASGGRMVVPVGPPDAPQVLRIVERDRNGRLRESDATTVRFVPFVARGG
jgi:protein-L-isoaspartate(D-aspartate) O-methyltransferase